MRRTDGIHEEGAGRSLIGQKMENKDDFKYILQDTGHLYLGARFTYKELLEQEMLPFKLKTIISQYLLKEIDASTTLESHFYYMDLNSFSGQTYQELKVKLKVTKPVEKKNLFGKKSIRFTDVIYSLKEWEELDLALKKKEGIIVREVIFSKIGLLSFAV